MDFQEKCLDIGYNLLYLWWKPVLKTKDMKTFKKLQIIYKHNKPYGIRDAGGFLFFFTDISKWTGQEERYRQEIQEQYDLADYLLKCLSV